LVVVVGSFRAFNIYHYALSTKRAILASPLLFDNFSNVTFSKITSYSTFISMFGKRG